MKKETCELALYAFQAVIALCVLFLRDYSLLSFAVLGMGAFYILSIIGRHHWLDDLTDAR